nr:MAG TPA: hypothetical protein [Caudoviricetes sp.]
MILRTGKGELHNGKTSSSRRWSDRCINLTGCRAF